MSTQQPSTPKGKWFLNKAQFPMEDPGSKQRYEPGQPTRGTPTNWIDIQIGAGVLVELVPDGDGGFVEREKEPAAAAAVAGTADKPDSDKDKPDPDKAVDSKIPSPLK